jgi:HlyD family secretion protein
MRSGLRTTLLILFGAAVMGALAWVSLRPEPVPVDLHVLERGPLEITVDADGRTRIREVYEVAAPIAGTALRAPVRAGDPVVAGETVVAIVEPVPPALLDARARIQAEASVREAEAALHVAQTELSRAEEERAYARAQFERVQTLVERGVASITRLEDADQQLRVAEAAVAEAEARIEMARGTLARAEAALFAPEGAPQADGPDACCVRIRAPADGVVLSVDVVSERPVVAGERLLSIGDPADLEIVADLLSSDAVRLAPGAEARVERWGGPEPLAARLERIEPAARTVVSALGIEEQRVDAVFSLVSPPRDRTGLGDGFSVFLRVVEWRTADALRLPLSAAFRSGDGWAVFVAEDGVARTRAVTLGRRNARFAEVVSGLAPGEAVVTHPSDEVVEGAPLADRDAP